MAVIVRDIFKNILSSNYSHEDKSMLAHRLVRTIDREDDKASDTLLFKVFDLEDADKMNIVVYDDIVDEYGNRSFTKRECDTNQFIGLLYEVCQKEKESSKRL